MVKVMCNRLPELSKKSAYLEKVKQLGQDNDI